MKLPTFILSKAKIIGYFCPMLVVVVGGGAAGFFGAIALAEAAPSVRVMVLERGSAFLQKVKVSGGGRCNVTHACFDARELVRNYPRGSRELAGPFTRFGPADTVQWFEERSVRLKTETDGRMFPITDNSQTIIDCLWQQAKRLGVELRPGCRVDKILPMPDGRWRVSMPNEMLEANAVLLTTGSSEAIWTMLGKLGHTVVPPVPSLFTFNIKDARLRDLAGVSMPMAEVRIPALKQTAQGPLLVTHWGLSGPCVLRLSAWAARALHECQYRFSLEINWLGNGLNEAAMLEELNTQKGVLAKKSINANAQYGLPARLWQSLCAAAELPDTLRWADATKKQLAALARELVNCPLQVTGKSTFKEEFVTAGGVSLKEVDFRTFGSKRLPNLYLAGEVLDIDAITGGFNFQAAWTGGWIAGQAIGAAIQAGSESVK